MISSDSEYEAAIEHDAGGIPPPTQPTPRQIVTPPHPLSLKAMVAGAMKIRAGSQGYGLRPFPHTTHKPTIWGS